MALLIANKSYETEDIQKVLVDNIGFNKTFRPKEANALLAELLNADADSKSDMWEVSKGVEYAVSNKVGKVYSTNDSDFIANVVKVGYGRYQFVREVQPKAVEAKPVATVAAPAPAAPSVESVTTVAAEPEVEMSLVPFIAPDYVPHGCFDIIRKVIKQEVFAPVWVSGLSGNGKTFGVEQACAKEGRELIIINISNETSEEDLIGSYILRDGNLIWKDGPVLVAMRRGAVLCLDEIDQARNSIMCLNTIAQGRPYYNKKTNEVITPVKGFQLIGTANTKGNGDGADMFAGAQIMNEAFLERFSIIIEQDYPTKPAERKMLAHHSDNMNFINTILDIAHSTRRSYEAGDLDALLTTRRLVHIVKNYEIFKDEELAIKMAIARFDSETQAIILKLYESLTV